jgi:hypothetical protein
LSEKPVCQCISYGLQPGSLVKCNPGLKTKGLVFLVQSRVSPFANRRRRATDEHSRDDTEEESVSSWTSFKNFLQQHCKAIPLVKKSPDGFHGCVAFEVEWANVRGINYSNELQARHFSKL